MCIKQNRLLNSTKAKTHPAGGCVLSVVDEIDVGCAPATNLAETSFHPHCLLMPPKHLVIFLTTHCQECQ